MTHFRLKSRFAFGLALLTLGMLLVSGCSDSAKKDETPAANDKAPAPAAGTPEKEIMPGGGPPKK